MEKNITTTSRIQHPINIYYIQKFLAYAMCRMPHTQFGQKVTMPAHEGDTIKWQRWAKPLAQTTPLDEVNDPTPLMPVQTFISSKVSQYGAKTRWSGWLELTGLSQNAAHLTEWLSDMYRLTLDTLCREVIAGTASSTTCSNGSGAGGTQLNKTDIDTVVRTLLGNDAEYITGLMGAAVGQGTSPLAPAFIGIAHTDLMNELEKVAGFKEVKNYARPGEAYDGEYGCTGMVRWILSTNGYKSGNYYYLPIIARDSYGNVNIPDGEDLLGYTPPENAGSEMKRYSVYYWLMNYACRILDDTRIHALICTV